MTCHLCGACTQHMGQTFDGHADVYCCPNCDHLQFVAVTVPTAPPVDPTVRAPDAHLGSERE